MIVKKKMTTFDTITKELSDIQAKKDTDYGGSFYNMCNKFGLVAAAIPLNNKVERINNLILNKTSAINESLEDSLKDLANYAIMTLIYLRNNGKNK